MHVHTRAHTYPPTQTPTSPGVPRPRTHVQSTHARTYTDANARAHRHKRERARAHPYAHTRTSTHARQITQPHTGLLRPCLYHVQTCAVGAWPANMHSVHAQANRQQQQPRKSSYNPGICIRNLFTVRSSTISLASIAIATSPCAKLVRVLPPPEDPGVPGGGQGIRAGKRQITHA